MDVIQGEEVKWTSLEERIRRGGCAAETAGRGSLRVYTGVVVVRAPHRQHVADTLGLGAPRQGERGTAPGKDGHVCVEATL